MKPSATQIFRSASPTTCFPLLGSCLFIGFLCWALIPMHSFVDFHVDWPMLLFKLRPQSLSATSLYASAGFNWWFLMSRHQSLVATSAHVFVGFNCLFLRSRHQSLVATSAHVFAAFNWSFLVSRHQSSVATSAHVFAAFN